MSIRKIYTEKQIQVTKELRKQDFFISVLHGAKRSGKTILNNDLFLQELLRVKKIAKANNIKSPLYILAGVSSKTIQNNILNELNNRYNLEVKADKHNNFTLFGVKIVLAYTGTKAGIGNIRGLTAYGAYVNEGSLATEEVFKEIISRCSGEGARILVDTNPDNPNHWLKKDYIDKSDGNIINFHFKLDDNTFLTQRYIDNIKNATPTGMFYDRDINGLWVTGEGVVYSDFDASKHFIKDVKDYNFTDYVVGVDWGYSHYGAIVVFGIDDKRNWVLVEEHAHQLKEIDFWVDVAKGVKERYGNVNFYCDSARPEHVNRFRREGIRAMNADKSRIAGIEEVARLIKSDRFFVSDKVKRFKEEVYSYVWDDKTGEPVKEFDDVLDACRYVVYTHTKYKYSKELSKR